MTCQSNSNVLLFHLFQKLLEVTEVDPLTLVHPEIRDGDSVGKFNQFSRLSMMNLYYFYIDCEMQVFCLNNRNKKNRKSFVRAWHCY